MIMRWLLLVVPLALGLRFFEADPLLIFATSLLAIVPLVELMGSATEQLAHRLGSVIGGLLNSTLSNAPELIIGMVALHNGLGRVVKASLTGSILVNLLVGLGCALVVGGLAYGTWLFERGRLRTTGLMLVMCGFCFIVPAVFRIGTPEGTRDLSLELSVILLALYAGNVLVNIFGHQDESLTPEADVGEGQPTASIRSLGALAIAAVLLAFVSDALSESLSPTAKSLGLSDTFSGIVLLGGVGGIGEVLTAYGRAFPKAPPVVVWDLSRRGGGYFPPHSSHRRGRDVDIVYPKLKKYRKRVYLRARMMDPRRTWWLIKRFIKTGDVTVIFMNAPFQRRLYRYAKKIGEPRRFLRKVFQYPGRRRKTIIRHSRGHHTHFHVRFRRERKRKPNS